MKRGKDWWGKDPEPSVGQSNGIVSPYSPLIRPSEMGTVQERMDADRLYRARQSQTTNRNIDAESWGVAPKNILQGVASLGKLLGDVAGETSSKEQVPGAIPQKEQYQLPPGMRDRQEADEWGVNSQDENIRTYRRWQREEAQDPNYDVGNQIVGTPGTPRGTREIQDPNYDVGNQIASGIKQKIGEDVFSNGENALDNGGALQRMGPSEEWKRNYYKVTGAASGEDPERLYQKGQEFERRNWNYLYGADNNALDNKKSVRNKEAQTGVQKLQSYYNTDAQRSIANSPSVPPQQKEAGVFAEESARTPQRTLDSADNSQNIPNARAEADYEGYQTRGLDELQSRSNQDLGKLALLAGMMKLGNSLGSVTTGRWW